MENKQFELTPNKLEEIRNELATLLDEMVIITEVVGTSKKMPKTTEHIGKLISISKNIFNIEQALRSTKIIKSFSLNDILINKISVKRM